MSFPFIVGLVGVLLVTAMTITTHVVRRKQIARIIALGYLRMQAGMPRLTLEQVQKKFPDLFNEKVFAVDAAQRTAGLTWFITAMLWIVMASMMDPQASWGISSSNGVGLIITTTLSLATSAFVLHLMIESIQEFRALRVHRSSFESEAQPQLA